LAITLAIDAMGGDHAPRIILEGLIRARKKNPHVLFKVYGLQEAVVPLLQELNLHEGVEFIPCSEVITGETEPRQAVRGFKDSSMRRAIMAVAAGEADGVVSAGNTGAYMVLAKLILKTLPGIYRPAITALLPTLDGRGVTMLDLGANVDVAPEVLIQFCLMGQAFSKCVQGIQNPSVALLNIGSEDLKGTPTLKETQGLIQATNIVQNYAGFIEGDQIFKRKADVIVTDGFTGNVALKTAEGTAQFFATAVKEELTRTWVSKIGAALLKQAFNRFKERLDPRQMNGAQFLGLQGVAVKSHGGTDEVGFASAVNVAIGLIENKVNDKIQAEIAQLQEALAHRDATAINFD
jgi:fatty acid/phospholipid synthesis protein PlsX